MGGHGELTKREQLFTKLIDCCAEALPERLTLESNQDFIYLSDVETYELYLISMSDPSDMTIEWEAYQGKKCYKLLQGRDEPCPFCTNHLLEREQDYIWRRHNKLLNRDFILKDRLVDWNGKTVRMEIVIDVTESSRINTVLQRSLENQNVLTGCIRRLFSAATLQEGCIGMMECLGQFFGAQNGGLEVIGMKPLRVIWNVQSGAASRAVDTALSAKALMCWEKKLQRGQQVLLMDADAIRMEDDALWREFKEAGGGTFCVTPIFVRQRLVGLIYLRNLTRQWSEISMLTMLAGYLSTLIEKEELEQDKLRLQYYDALADCPNFDGFKQQVGRLLQEYPGNQYALWYFDIKSFKYVNDVFGYDIGDRLLQYLSCLLRQAACEGDTFGRVSGDNFTAFCRYQKKEELNERFTNLVERLMEFGPTEARKYRLDIVAGVYCIQQQDDIRSLDEMMNRANMAQKSVKPLAGSQIAYYDDTLRQTILQNLKLEASMQDALQNNLFELYLQPQISLKPRDKVLYAEVLVRWRQPDGSLLMPGQFIGLFEQDGMIVDLDRYMFEHACSFLHDWNRASRSALCLAVNVSRVSMLRADFVKDYCRIKEQYHIPDGYIELEFTETVVVENYDQFRGIVSQLRAHGFLCAVDDFGTCQSSLNLLRNLPFDVLKLDKEFFLPDGDPVRGQAVVECVLQLAQALHMKTVAEGIESHTLVDMLREMGCDRVQGFVFSRAISAASYAAKSDDNLRIGALSQDEDFIF